MEMKAKKPRLPSQEILKILNSLAEDKKYDEITDTGHGKQTIIDAKRWFISLPWNEAKAFCGNSKKILEIRDDYFKRMAEEAIYTDPVTMPKLEKHIKDLQSVAKIIAHYIEEALTYKNNNNIDIISVIPSSFWDKKGQPVNSLKIFEYAREHKVDSLLAECLYKHYENEFGKLDFESWEKVTKKHINRAVLDNLKLLAFGTIKVDQECPVCRKILS